jgi:biotin operon repressor
VIVSEDTLQKFDGEPVVPFEVQHFVLERIKSIAQLEALIMMRNAPDTWWPSSSMAERLYISERACRAELDALREQGLLVAKQDDIGWRFRYAPASGELRELMDRLVYYYGKHLVVISNLIHSKPRTRLHEFSEAFSLKKKDS